MDLKPEGNGRKLFNSLPDIILIMKNYTIKTFDIYL